MGRSPQAVGVGAACDEGANLAGSRSHSHKGFTRQSSSIRCDCSGSLPDLVYTSLESFPSRRACLEEDSVIGKRVERRAEAQERIRDRAAVRGV